MPDSRIFTFGEGDEYNPAQEAFVMGPETYSAYLGGVGSGKSFAGIIRILLHMDQPIGRDEDGNLLAPPRALIGAETEDVLKDIILAQTWDRIQNIIADRAPNAPFAQRPGKAGWNQNDLVATLNNGARVEFRSLFHPKKLRGRELTAYHIDEGRNVSRAAWDRLFDRLRQPGYKRAGFVTSTTNGFDWMYDLFHAEGSERGSDPTTGDYFKMYNASTEANERNLPPEYIAALKANLTGDTYLQEYEGKFIGRTDASVFPHWKHDVYQVPLEYDASLPLYSLWDFGIGDPGVVLWVQIASDQVWVDVKQGDSTIKIPQYIKTVRILDYKEEKDWNADQWAAYYHDHVYNSYGRKQTNGDYGDPAGHARNPSTGTSVIKDLNAAGVPVQAAVKRPEDYGIRILTNYISGGRLLVNSLRAGRVSKALTAHRWPTDKDGHRTGRLPVHDWTSHFVACLRYGAQALLGFKPVTGQPHKEPPPPPGSIGAIVDNLISPPDQTWMGPQPSRTQWVPRTEVGA